MNLAKATLLGEPTQSRKNSISDWDLNWQQESLEGVAVRIVANFVAYLEGYIALLDMYTCFSTNLSWAFKDT